MFNQRLALLLLLLAFGSLFWARHWLVDLFNQPQLEPTTELTVSEFSQLLLQNHNVKLHWLTKPDATTPIAADLLKLPPEQAVLQALPGYKLFLVFQPTSTQQHDAKLSEVWIAPQGFLISAASAPSKTNCYPQSEFTDTDTTQLKIDQIAVGGSDATAAFESALRNPDENARYRAVIAASESHLQNIGPILTELLQLDASEIVRIAALDALSKAADIDKPAFIRLVNIALQDDSINVRNRAVEYSASLQSEP